MPRVPIPDYQRQVQPGSAGSMPRAQGTPEPAYIGGSLRDLAQGLSGDEDAVLAYQKKFQDETNETETNDAYVKKFAPAFREFYNGYYSLQGKDAVDQRPEFEKKMQDLRTEVRDGLGNETQKKLFDSMSRGRIEAELDGMARHAATQRKAWMVQTHDATLGNIALQAADKFNDANAFNMALNAADAEIDRHGAAMGESSEVMRQKAAAFRGVAWKQRIERAALYDPLGAAEMYQANTGAIAAADRPVLEHKLKLATMPVEARLAVDRIMTGQKLDDLERAIDQGDKSFLKVAAQAQDAAPMPTNVRDTRAMMPTWLSQIEGYAERRYPGDVMMKDMMVNVAKGRLTTITQAQEAVQRQAQGDLIERIVQRKPGSIDALLAQPGARDAWGKLDPQAQLGIVHLAGRGDGDQVRTNPKVMQDVFDRIHADDGDPRKITSQTELAQFFGHGLNFTDYSRLKSEFIANQTPEGNRFLRDVQTARLAARRIMGAGMLGSILKDTEPDRLEAAAQAFAADLDGKIEQYRKDKKDPRDLLTPGKPDYVLTPERIRTYLGSAPSAIATAAGKAKNAALPKITSDDDYAKLASGAEFIGPDGIRRRKP